MQETITKTQAKSYDILVVEDSQTFITYFKDVFAKWNYPVSIITDGAEAWSAILRQPPKILLLDWNLPGLDGVTICRKLRALQNLRYVYVIILTSNDQLKDKVAGFEAGADDYVTKPFQPEFLHAKIKVGMRIVELEDHLSRKATQLVQSNLEQEVLIGQLREKHRIITEQKQELHQAQQRLFETARRAGMAEIATSVLHNVGNLLNTAITSSSIIGEVVNNSRIVTLAKLADFLQQQAGNFTNFVATDPRGQKLPEFVQQINQVLTQEHDTIKSKLASLIESNEQIRQIIALQQSYAGLSGVKETMEIKALLQDATRLVIESYKRHDIDLIYEIEENLPAIEVEKQKVLQILMNLLCNAGDATKSMERNTRMIQVIAHRQDAGVAIKIRDNGEGIPAENMTRIFNFGFTTKKDGHGFGLHGCANLARELGGSLTAASEGENKGSIFTLWLPQSSAGAEGASTP